jgi:hypothetical protein
VEFFKQADFTGKKWVMSSIFTSSNTSIVVFFYLKKEDQQQYITSLQQIRGPSLGVVHTTSQPQTSQTYTQFFSAVSIFFFAAFFAAFFAGFFFVLI